MTEFVKGTSIVDVLDSNDEALLRDVARGRQVWSAHAVLRALTIRGWEIGEWDNETDPMKVVHPEHAPDGTTVRNACCIELGIPTDLDDHVLLNWVEFSWTDGDVVLEEQEGRDVRDEMFYRGWEHNPELKLWSKDGWQGKLEDAIRRELDVESE